MFKYIAVNVIWLWERIKIISSIFKLTDIFNLLPLAARASLRRTPVMNNEKSLSMAIWSPTSWSSWTSMIRAKSWTSSFGRGMRSPENRPPAWLHTANPISTASEPISWMNSGNRSTLTISWRWCRHTIEYTQENRYQFFVLRDFAGIGSAPHIKRFADHYFRVEYV